MAPSPQTRRFRVNPVEMVIFGLVCTVLVNSVYHLFYDWDGIRPVAVHQLPDRDPNDPAGDRKVSSPPSTPTFANMEVNCGANAQATTSADRVRLTGTLCGAQTGAASGRSPASMLRTEILNQTNRAQATVFTDPGSGKFSTDFIPLAAGVNRIELRFVYPGGRTVMEQFNVLRAEN